MLGRRTGSEQKSGRFHDLLHRRMPLSPAAWAAIALVTLFFLCLSTMAILRFEAYRTRSFDLAIVVRMLWGIRHGDFQEFFTNQPWIAYHFEPLMLVLSLFDALAPAVHGLLVAQSAAIAATGLVAYRLGSRLLGSPAAGVLATTVALLYPAIGHVGVFDVHMVAFAIAPALWLLDALDRGARREALLAAALTVACREDGFVFVALALLAVPAESRAAMAKRVAASAVCLAVFAAYVLLVQQPLTSGGALHAHFAAFGATPSEILWTLLTEPGRIVDALVTPRSGKYLATLLVPLALLPLAAPRRSLPAAWTIALNLLSQAPGTADIIDSHYSALAIPALLYGAFHGAANVRSWLARIPAGRKIGIAIPAFLLAAVIVGQAAWGTLPGAGEFLPDDFRLTERSTRMDALVSRIQADGDASCSLPIDAVAHAAQRPRPFVLPDGVTEATWVLADLDSRGVIGADAARYQARIRGWIDRALASGMDVVDQQGPLVLLRRRPRRRPPMGRRRVAKGLQEACRAWIFRQAPRTYRRSAAGCCRSGRSPAVASPTRTRGPRVPTCPTR